ncbi:MAG: alpha/beta fold hydrolase [Janthinobacterium lividum]
MKKLLLLLLPLLFPCLLFSQTEPVNYKTVSTNFQKFYNESNADSLHSCLSTDAAKLISLDQTAALIKQLQAGYGKLKTLEFINLTSPVASYKANFEKSVLEMSLILNADNKINGFFFKPYQEKKVVEVDPELTESPITLTVPDASLSGSIVTPKNSAGKIPVILIIAGSGSTDRDGNGFGLTANSYLLLANDLGKSGIATLRYDKRYSGKTTTSKTEAELRFGDYVDDAVALIKLLKSDSRFSKVVVLGHSEGSLVGMLALEREKADGYISLAGPGDAINKTLAIQLKNQSPEEYKITLGRLDSLSKGLMVKAAATDLLFRPSVQPYMISWMKYNPQTEIKKLKMPVLIVQGTNDVQVSVADAKNLKLAKPDATLVLIDGMNHVLKPAPYDREKNLATYSQPLLPLDSNLQNAVVDFVKAQ